MNENLAFLFDSFFLKYFKFLQRLGFYEFELFQSWINKYNIYLYQFCL